MIDPILCDSSRESVGWWVSNTDDLKAWSWKQIISQRGPANSPPMMKLVNLWFPVMREWFFLEISVWMPYLCASECLYSIHGTVIISITVPIVKEFITAMEVTLFGSVFHKQ